MSKADRPDQPNAAERFNEDQATYTVKGGGETPDLEAGLAGGTMNVRKGSKTVATV